MKDDFTRDTFDSAKHFSRVLMQQGRVTLDADHNEQTDILLHAMRTLTRDLLGPYAVPSGAGGFQLLPKGKDDLTITAGRMYVDGILVENEEDCSYGDQPDFPLPANDPFWAELQKPGRDIFWLYLDVWERNVTWIEDGSIRESALNGPDTCARSKVVWQVKALTAAELKAGFDSGADLQKEIEALKEQLSQTSDPIEGEAIKNRILELEQLIATSTSATNATNAGGLVTAVTLSCDGPLVYLNGLSNASMTARLDPGKQIQDPCTMSPDAQYRGAENQLYRVEIHTGGLAGVATFKWSRDNGSVASPWLGTTGNDIQVTDTRGFTAGAWVELSDDVLDLQGLPGVLVKLANVGGGVLSVDPSTVTATTPIAWNSQMIYPKIRRWDQQSSDALQLSGGAVPITEKSATNPAWIDLEDGIQVQFSPAGSYRTGDYWTIPARVATGQIEWPSTPDANGKLVNDAVAPDGIEHHYAPLGMVRWMDSNLQLRRCRCEFDPINNCYGKGSIAVGAHLLLNPLNTRANLSAERQRSKRRSKG